MREVRVIKPSHALGFLDPDLPPPKPLICERICLTNARVLEQLYQQPPKHALWDLLSGPLCNTSRFLNVSEPLGSDETAVQLATEKLSQHFNSASLDDLVNNAGIDCFMPLSQRDYGSSAGAQDLSSMRFGARKNGFVDFAIGVFGHHCSQRTVGSYWASAVAD